MAGESKGACDLGPPTPVKFVQGRYESNSAADGKCGGGEGHPGVVARKVSFMAPENPSSSSNIGGSGINQLPRCIIIEKSDNKRPHQESNLACEFRSDRMKASNESKNTTPKKGNERKKREKVKRHRPRVLDKSKKKKPPTPKPKNPSTPKPRTPKRPKLADKNNLSNRTAVEPPKAAHREEVADCNENISNKTPVEPPKAAHREEVADCNENISNKTPVEPPKAARWEEVAESKEYICRRKLDFDIENQTTTDQSQKASFEVESKPEVGAKLQEPLNNGFSSLIVYRRAFRLNKCLKKSRSLGPNFTGVFKKARTRRPRATTFDKFFRLGSLPPTTQKKNSSVMNELMSLGPIVRGRLTRSQTRESVKHPDFKKWAMNLHWKMRRRRSKTLARKCYSPSFVHDISKLQFSQTFISKASAIRIKDVNREITVAHVEAQDQGVLNLDKKESIERQELHPDNVDSYQSSQICPEDFDDPMVGVEMSLDINNYRCKKSLGSDARRKPSFVGLTDDEEVEGEEERDAVVVEDDDVLDRQDYDSFTKALVDYASQMMVYLCIDDTSNQAENEPVLSEENTQLVLSQENKELILSKKKPRKTLPKIDLDLDLVMSSGENKDSETEYWVRERALYEGRLDEFIAAMNILHAKNRFSAWKGSVVDSVIGVFLTQNVSDHLSSSAFMNLAARFPAVSDHSGRDCDGESDSERLKITEGHSDEHEQIFSDHSSAFMNVAARFPPVSDHSDRDCDGESDSARLKITEGHSDEHEQIFTTEPDLGSCHDSQNEVNMENENEAEPISSQSESTPEIKRGEGVKKGKLKKQEKINWDELRTKYSSGKSKNRTDLTTDSVNWEAVRQATLKELANVIKDRGMMDLLAARIKKFLDRIVADHGAIDLEWLRDVPPEKVKEYLLSFEGLGLKSVECVRLLSLHHAAFPVDVNISRIATRLGWITLRDLPDGLRIHELNEYPNLDSVQRFLAPRLKDISHAKLYEFHCHLILFGKTVCTKDKPNCKICPFRPHCKHFASMCASARPRLEGYPTTSSQETQGWMPLLEGSHWQNMSSASSQESRGMVVQSQAVLMGPDGDFLGGRNSQQNCEPIIEIPESPVCECSESDADGCRQLDDLEDVSNDEEDEMLTLDLSQMQRNLDNSRALACMAGTAPVLKLKELQRLRTIHQVYELPDSHPLLTEFGKRNPADPCPYLLAIWMPGMPEETTNSSPNLENANMSEEPTNLGDIVKYRDEGTIQGTILIPCRTVNRGSFPLNGTYFQLNQMFADHESSVQPMDIPREYIWNLTRRLLYCSTSIRSICKGMTSSYELGSFFHTAFMCIKAFDRASKSPKPLHSRFHDTKGSLKRQPPKPKQ